MLLINQLHLQSPLILILLRHPQQYGLFNNKENVSQLKMPSHSQHWIDFFVWKSITMAIAGNVAVNALTHTQAAKQAQKLQQKKSKRSIQREGVVYAEIA